MQQIAAIILAAGTSSRMGAEKNTLILSLQGRPLLTYVIEAVLGSHARPIILVLGHQANEVREHIQAYQDQLTIIENPAYSQGLSTSMQAGLRVLLSEKENTSQHSPTGAIFLLGDQPMLTPRLIDKLLTLREQTGKRIVVPRYQGQRGNPVVFSLDLASELMQVRGDEGGRSVLKRYPEEIATLEIDTPTANVDVDTWEAYLKVQALSEQEMLE